MKCPVCGAAELVRDTRDLPISYKGRTTVLMEVTGDFCDACGEGLFDPLEGDRYMKALRQLKQDVDA
jgi:HTH-type transcriptional regulator / antitoxin MqsA